MVDLLNFINEKLTQIDIPYEYGEWTKKVTYPYFVGDYNENSYSFEDGHSTGVFTLNGWCKGSKMPILFLCDRIKKAFQDVRGTVESSLEWDIFSLKDGMVDEKCSAFYVTYNTCIEVPTGDEDLYRIMITLNTHEWKGV